VNARTTGGAAILGVLPFVPRAAPFKVLMIGPDESSKRKAAEALGRILAEALGRAPRTLPPGTI
jgi:hypothetical protein